MAWTLYKEIRYDANGIPGENLTDFAKRISITGDTDIAAECASGGGYKLTSADGSSDLAFGSRPQTNLASGDVHCNFKVTLLTSASVGDVVARLYYSASESTSDDKAGTVSADYTLFMPLEEDPSGSAPQMLDWVSETNLATSAGSMTSGDLVAGQVGNGLDLDGSNDLLTFTHADPGDTFTCEAIVKPASVSGARNILSSNSTAGSFNFRANGTALQAYSPSGVRAAASSVFSNGVQAGVAYVSNGDLGEHALFLDGASLTLSTNTTQNWTNGTSRVIGSRTAAGSEFYSGVIDEVRFSSVARSSLWLACQHEDDFDNASTFTLSAEMGGGGPMIADAPVAVATASAVLPTTRKTTTVAPAVAIATANAPQSGIIAEAPVAVAFVAGIAPATIKTATVAPAVAMAACVAPLTTKLATVSPAIASAAGIAPATTKRATVSPAIAIAIGLAATVEGGAQVEAIVAGGMHYKARGGRMDFVASGGRLDMQASGGRFDYQAGARS